MQVNENVVEMLAEETRAYSDKENDRSLHSKLSTTCRAKKLTTIAAMFGAVRKLGLRIDTAIIT
jgi:hypothetical protein